MLRAVVDRNDLRPSEKITELVLTGLRYTHEQWSDRPRMNELVEAVSRERKDIVDRHRRMQRTLLQEAIEQGVALGEFAVDDPQVAADAVLSATFLFDFPTLMSLYPLEVFELSARQVCRLLLEGLRKC